jgi:hypothetical protein
MAIQYLLKSQANQVFKAIEMNGWEPSEFEWQDTQGFHSGNKVSQLVHKASGYYFVFDNADGFWSKWSPGEETQERIQHASDWAMQLNMFGNWLSYLRRETESPDLWGAISNEARILESAASSDTSNAPFSAQEKEYILTGLNEIKQYLLTAHKPDPELVESRLNYLAESSNHLGRKDWLNVLISVLVGIVISAALPPEATRDLFRFVGTVLRQILNSPLLLA